MTNILNKMKENDVHTHINKAYALLDEHLPYEYAKEVVTELAKSNVKVTAGTVRNVKAGKTSRLDVLNALLLIAKRNKKQKEKLKSNLNI
jgi:hypothetical protein